MMTKMGTARQWSGSLVACMSVAFASLAAASVAMADDQPLPHNPQCTIQSFVGADRHVPNHVHDELAPTGTLLVGVNYGNGSNATRDDAGLLHGVAIDLACVLAQRLGVEVQFIGYPAAAPMLQGYDNGEWTVGFSFSPDFAPPPPPDLLYAHPHIGVANTYLVPGDSPIQTVDDADRPGVRISVGVNNSADIFLTAHLQFAQLVRFDTNGEALAAVRDGVVDACASGRTAETLFLPQMPGGRILPDNFLIAYLAQVLPPGLRHALRYVDRFVEQAKIWFLIQFAVCRAGLLGASVPPPLVDPEQSAFRTTFTEVIRKP
jgi:polar amino acid transport system substrate-binding protein